MKSRECVPAPGDKVMAKILRYRGARWTDLRKKDEKVKSREEFLFD
jgi:hypothetical protein